MDGNYEQIYNNIPVTTNVGFNFDELSTEEQKEQNQFISNNRYAASSWLGASGDGFLFAANTITGYFGALYTFAHAFSKQIEGANLHFEAIDTEISNSIETG